MAEVYKVTLTGKDNDEVQSINVTAASEEEAKQRGIDWAAGNDKLKDAEVTTEVLEPGETEAAPDDKE